MIMDIKSLCSFSCCFDVQKDIETFVKSIRAKDRVTGEVTQSSSDEQDKPDFHIRIIGQERFSEVLFVWDDVCPYTNDVITQIGVHDPVKQTNSVLFVHDSKLNIVSCTLNQEHSMIAYVTLEGASPQTSSQESTTRKPRVSPFHLYRAFLAEIFPQNRIFDLNLERRNLMRAQFIWSRQARDQDSLSRESRLLVFLHKESIGLYTLTLARVGNKGMMMSGSPDTQQLVRQFIWAQWDCNTQRLFVALMRQRPGDDKPVPILRCLEFTSKTMPLTKILELVLPFPIKYSNEKEEYSDVPLSRTISESSFNMEVIVQPGGSLCVCYQHPIKTKRPSTPSSPRMSASTPDISNSSELDIEKPTEGSMDAWELDSQVRHRRTVSDASGLSPNPGSRKRFVHTPELSPVGSYEDMTRSTEKISPLSFAIGSRPGRTHHSAVLGIPRISPNSLMSPILWGERELRSPSPTTEKLERLDLHYSVLVLHHMTVLHCSVPQISLQQVRETRLYFTPLESYILVYSPGQIMHLLNVSPEVAPCLHIAFHGSSVPTGPVVESNASWGRAMSGKSLTHFHRQRAGSASGDCILNADTGKAFRVSINKDIVPQLLIQANCHTVKLALIHLMTVHLRDTVLIQNMFKELSRDAMSLDLSELMAEYLIGATFSCSRRQFDWDTLRLLQFTNADITRGQLVETTDGERLVSFRHASYNLQPNVFVHKRDWMERRLTLEVSASTLWETLERRLGANTLNPEGSTIQRFHPRTIEQQISKQRTQSLLEDSLSIAPATTPRPSFLKKMAATARRAMSSSRKAVISMKSEQDSSLILMEEDGALPDRSQDSMINLTLEQLVAHLERYSTQTVSRDKHVNIAQEFLTCQLQQVRQLVLLLLNSCGLSDPGDIPRRMTMLSKKPNETSYQLFRLLERFVVAVKSVCFPFPVGFQTFFTIQGYHCLLPSMFLQYVDHGILRLTEEFVTRLVLEVADDCKAAVNMKIQVISRLSKNVARYALRKWNHPASMQYLAREYAADILIEEGLKTNDLRNRPYRSTSDGSQSSGSSDSGIAATFPPLSTLIRLLERKDPRVKTGGKSSSNVHHFDSNFLKEVALQETVAQYGSDLSAVSF